MCGAGSNSPAIVSVYVTSYKIANVVPRTNFANTKVHIARQQKPVRGLRKALSSRHPGSCLRPRPAASWAEGSKSTLFITRCGLGHYRWRVLGEEGGSGSICLCRRQSIRVAGRQAGSPVAGKHMGGCAATQSNPRM